MESMQAGSDFCLSRLLARKEILTCPVTAITSAGDVCIDSNDLMEQLQAIRQIDIQQTGIRKNDNVAFQVIALSQGTVIFQPLFYLHHGQERRRLVFKIRKNEDRK